jgi:hypothetical protein
MAFRTGALRIVEGKEIRRRILVGDPTLLAFQAVGKGERPAVFRLNAGSSPAVLHRRLERIGQTLPVVRVGRKPVDEDRQGPALEGWKLVERNDPAVDQGPEKAELLEGGRAFFDHGLK